MRVLWQSAHPNAGSGYGQQTALWARYLRWLGHDVAISTIGRGPRGQQNLAENITDYDGIPVLLGAAAAQPRDYHALLPARAKEWDADVVITLCDTWLINPIEHVPHCPMICWTPVDGDRLGAIDGEVLRRSGALPLAMSLHGLAAMRAAGLSHPQYLPHAIDTQLFTPPADRAALRTAAGIGPGTFVIGILGTVVDILRKGFAEQMYAFKLFHQRHPQSLLAVHSFMNDPQGLNLLQLAQRLGIMDHVRWADQERLAAWDFTPAEVAAWYGACDIVSNTSYGEGFGLAAVEAQACGTPVVLARNSTGPELVGPGWLVKTQPFWHKPEQAWWGVPSIGSIASAYGNAWKLAAQRRSTARAFAVEYDVETVGGEWPAVLDAAVNR